MVTFPDSVPSDHMILDIGPKTLMKYIQVIQDSDCVFMNGAMGYFE